MRRSAQEWNVLLNLRRIPTLWAHLSYTLSMWLLQVRVSLKIIPRCLWIFTCGMPAIDTEGCGATPFNPLPQIIICLLFSALNSIPQISAEDEAAVTSRDRPTQSMRRPPKSAEIGVLRPGRSHIQAVFAPMAEEGDIGLLSVVVWAFLAQCDPFLNKIEFVKDLSLRTKTCNKFFSQFLAEIVQRWLRWFLDGIAVQNFGCVHRETEDYTRKSEILER